MITLQNTGPLTVAVKAVENGLDIADFGRLFKRLTKAAAKHYSQHVITPIASMTHD